MVRRFLLSTAAAAVMAGSVYAADIPHVPPPPPYIPPVPIFTWTGFYVGVNAGGAFRPSSNDGFNDAVFIGGVQVGYNWQINNFVLGIEGDGQALVGSNNNNNTFGFIGNGSTTNFLG